MNARSRLILGFLLTALLAGTGAWFWAGSRDRTQASDNTSPGSRSGRAFSNGKPALPAPVLPVSPTAPAPPADNERAVHPVLEKLLKEGGLKVRVEQLQEYLNRSGRDAESLLAAFQLTKDASLLKEAATRFPKDPRVQMALALHTQDPKEREQALQAMVAADPDNALGYYLSADNALKAGRTDEAVNLLLQAGQSSKLSDYLQASVIANEEAYRAAGFSPLEAKLAATYGAELPFLTNLRELSQSMKTLQDAYTQAGDQSSASSVLSMGLDLGQRVQQSMGSTTLISELVGASIEQRFLKGLDPASVLEGSGLTVQQRLDQLAAKRDVIKQISHSVDPTTAGISEELLMQFAERQRVLGELAALQWLQGRLKNTPAR